MIAPVIIVTLYSIHDREETHGSITTTFFIATNYGSSLSGSFFYSVQNLSIHVNHLARGGHWSRYMMPSTVAISPSDTEGDGRWMSQVLP